MRAGIDAVLPALRPLSEPPRPPGWNHAQLRDLLDGPPEREAAVLVPLIDEREPRLVLTERTAHLRQHAGQVAFPGGGVEAHDADIIATALRETEEEIGLPGHAVTPIGFLDCFETISGFVVTPVVARVAAERPPWRPDPSEVDTVFEVPLDFFLDPANLRRYTMNYRGRERAMVEFHFDGHRIWGATAAMITNLLKRMGCL
ncbi:CoA pyrophosphatase [Oleiagrimonas sp. C23AA]|nr:CoA pyrophosphatase [Oleiagrimonas sp. C23AA]NII09143.1 CoA pyrophosphatase [Oleiagrimonas sp. C23AA]